MSFKEYIKEKNEKEQIEKEIKELQIQNYKIYKPEDINKWLSEKPIYKENFYLIVKELKDEIEDKAKIICEIKIIST